MTPLVTRDTRGSSGTIGVIALNRPDRANAFTPEMARELRDALDWASSSDQVKAIVLTGTGKQFCAGMDATVVAQIAQAHERGSSGATALQSTLLEVQRATLALSAVRKPVVAAINGSAAAGGLDIALACDYRIASSAATFVQSYARLGLPPLNGSTFFLGRLISRSAAFRLLSTAESLTADQALSLGIVDRVYAPEDVLDEAIDLAERMSIASPELVSHLKDEFDHQYEGELAATLERAFRAGSIFVESEEFRRASARMLSPAHRAATPSSSKPMGEVAR
ncbi:MAG: paaG2 [Subtercola sp.]|nr:paaG2 [Subtercola sp.]